MQGLNAGTRRGGAATCRGVALIQCSGYPVCAPPHQICAPPLCVPEPPRCICAPPLHVPALPLRVRAPPLHVFALRWRTIPALGALF